MRTDLALAIVGPTASGKTDLAIACARRLSGQLIGTDSMQAYRGLSVGTAKPTAQELGGIRHHMLDVWPLTYSAHVAEFQEIARACVMDVFTAGDVPIVVGGSVLYLNAVLDVYDFPGTDPAVRGRYEELLISLGSEELHRMLQSKDLIAANQIASSNGRRIVRALEVIDITGGPFQAHLPERPQEFFPACRVGIEIDRPALDQRIVQRVDDMCKLGLIEEVEVALVNGLRESVTAGKAIGYSQIIEVIDGDLTLEQAKSQIVTATQKFARRQQRWFRQDPRITWFPWDAENLDVKVLTHFDEILRSHQSGE